MRKMAYVVTLDNVVPHGNADLLEIAIVNGWQVVVKKDEFKRGDFAVYCEIDSFVPNEIAPFLTKQGNDPREFNNVKGERIRTIKLRGEISQGLLLPMDVLPLGSYCAGEDVSEKLGIVKWEPPLDLSIGGEAVGLFPGFIEKTDQERIQNFTEERLAPYRECTFEVTEKLDGCSVTYWLDGSGFHACSRNMEMRVECENPSAIARFAVDNKLPESLAANGLYRKAIQGELVGPKINGNNHGLGSLRFFIFDVYDIDAKKRASPEDCRKYADRIRTNVIDHVPVLIENFALPEGDTVHELLAMAEGKSQIGGKDREGIVLKANEDSRKHFKAISNKYLLKHD